LFRTQTLSTALVVALQALSLSRFLMRIIWTAELIGKILVRIIYSLKLYLYNYQTFFLNREFTHIHFFSVFEFYCIKSALHRKYNVYFYMHWNEHICMWYITLPYNFKIKLLGNLQLCNLHHWKLSVVISFIFFSLIRPAKIQWL
jgi:hypothetical protein